MPFKSEKQRKYLWANEPEIARDWTDTYGSGIHKAKGGRIGFQYGSPHEEAAASRAGTHAGENRARQERQRDDHWRQTAGQSYTPTSVSKPKPKEDKPDRNIIQRGIDKAVQFNKAIQSRGIAGMAKKDLAAHIAKLNRAGKQYALYDEDETWEDLVPSYKDPNLFEEGRGYRDKTIQDFDTGKRTYEKAGIGPDFFVPGEGGISPLTNLIGSTLSGPMTAERLRHLQTQAGELSTLDPNTMTRDEYMQEYRPGTYARDNRETPREGEGGGEIPWWLYPQGGIASAGAGSTPFDLGLGSGDWNFILPEAFLQGPRLAQVAEGGRVPAAFGGIMDTETGRRGYFGGSFNPFKAAKKLVKKASKTVKKIAKSPIGKLALGYLATSGLGSLGTEATGWQRFAPKMFKAGLGKMNPLNYMGGETALGMDDAGLNPNWKLNLLKDKAIEFAKSPLGMITLGGAGIGAASAMGPQQIEADIGAERSEEKAWWDAYLASLGENRFELEDQYKLTSADGGRVPAETGGLMDLGGLEKDYRNDGGFVPIGGEERADDVPARLSKNEFVMTADAVRGAGGGDIDRGAEVMETVMDKLQGKHGRQEMFEISERLSEVV